MKITLDPVPSLLKNKCKVKFKMESVEVGPFNGHSTISETDMMNIDYTTKQKLVKDIHDDYVEFCEESKKSEIFKQSKNVIIHINLFDFKEDALVRFKMDIAISPIFYEKNYLFVIEKMLDIK